MGNVVCPICNSDFITQNTFSKCQGCGYVLFSLDMKLTDMENNFHNYYDNKSIINYYESYRRKIIYFNVLRLISSYNIKYGFDLGASTGSFLTICRKRGINCIGVDYGFDSLKNIIMKKSLQDKFLYLDINNIDSIRHHINLEEKCFITILDTLRHLENGVELLKFMIVNLKPGSIIVIKEGNPLNKMIIKKFSKNTDKYKMLFSVKSLKRFCENNRSVSFKGAYHHLFTCLPVSIFGEKWYTSYLTIMQIIKN